METSNPTPTTLPSLHHHSQSHHQVFSNSELKFVTVTINDKAQQQALLAAGAKATRKSSTQRSSSPFKSKQTIVSTRNLLGEEGNGEKEVKVDKMIIRKNALRNAIYDLKVEFHQLQTSPSTLKIINQISTCLLEQSIDPSSFFSTSVNKQYASAKSAKGFRLRVEDEHQVIVYIAQRCGAILNHTHSVSTTSVTLPKLYYAIRTSRRTHFRLRLLPKSLQCIVHFSNLLSDNDSSLEELFKSGEPEKEEDEEIAVMDEGMVVKAVEFIDSLGNGDGEVEMHELRAAFRRARQLVVQSNPATSGRSKTHKLAKALKLLNCTAEEWFYAHADVSSEEDGIGQMALFKALRRMSDEILTKLSDKESGLSMFKFTDDHILDMMSFLDPNQDGTVTLQEINDGLRRAREDPNNNAEQAAAAKVLKHLEMSMIEEGANLAEIFAEIDKDGSGSVNSSELGPALQKFHERRMKRKRVAEFDYALPPSDSNTNNYSLQQTSYTKKFFLILIENWIKQNNIHDADWNNKDLETLMSFLDPFGDNEITLNEISDAIEFARKGGGVKAINASGQTFAYSEVKAARLLSRIASSLFCRKVLPHDVFFDTLRKEAKLAKEKKKEDAALVAAAEQPPTSASEEKKDDVPLESSYEDDEYDDEAFEEEEEQSATTHTVSVTNLVAELCLVTQTECPPFKSVPLTAAVLEAKLTGNSALEQNGSTTQKEIVAVNKQALEMAVIDVCNVANRRVQILSAKDIRFACDYLTMGERDYATQQDIINSFMYASPDYLEEHENRAAELRLVRKFDHLMVKNGHTLSKMFDEVFNDEGDADKANSKTIVRKSSSMDMGGKKNNAPPPPPSIVVSHLIKRCLVDSADAVRESMMVSPSAEAKKKRENDQQDQVTQRKLKNLMGLSADEEFRVTTAIDAPKPNWKELQGLKEELLKSCSKKKDTAMRISATVGFIDSARVTSSLKWVILYTGEVSNLGIEDVVDKLLEKSRSLTLYTIRVQQIELNARKEEVFRSVAFVAYMTGASAPRVLETSKRNIKVAWPTLNTSKVGDCDIKLSLEVCKGREWRSGKCRQSANTLSLLSSSGKRAFRTVYSIDVADAVRQGLGRGRGKSQNITITDLDPACWYHLRFKISYKVLPTIHSAEEQFFYEDGFEMVDASGKGRSFGGIRSVATQPDCPEAPNVPRCILSHMQRVMQSGGKNNVKANVKLHWVAPPCNGYKIKSYILQRRVGFLKEETQEEQNNLHARLASESMDSVTELESVLSMESNEDLEGFHPNIVWRPWETVYSNQIEQYFSKTPPLGTVGMKFRLCAVNDLGPGPWGEALNLYGPVYQDFFDGAIEEGPGNIGGEGGLDKPCLETLQTKMIGTVADYRRTQGKEKRNKLESEEQGRVVAFGRAVQDDLFIYGGGKMKLLMAMSEGRSRPNTSGHLPTVPLRDLDSTQIQLERNAAVIQSQVEYPVSLSAAKAALKKVSVQDKKVVNKLISSRGSPSPKNYLQHIRDVKMGQQRLQSHRPKTAPTVETLTGKWIADDFLS
ncbi:hypothetical protein TrLO_g11052 [Triparma laevis f. longispina]|uniref:EF-hand domain-containing protein n=1 Tax=Triparma laevis f. longispina TaxID=1714387 RepID=A0A9W7CIN8_9STRA|nr:hypothetical protein TrLO_g11052 [Triparma laevis f. longispina]